MMSVSTNVSRAVSRPAKAAEEHSSEMPPMHESVLDDGLALLVTDVADESLDEVKQGNSPPSAESSWDIHWELAPTLHSCGDRHVGLTPR